MVRGVTKDLEVFMDGEYEVQYDTMCGNTV